MNDRAILDGKIVKPIDDIHEWGMWFQNMNNRVVAQNEKLGVKVSTVFLGLNHKFLLDGPDQWFETMIFGGEHDGFQDRYETWDEAEAGHGRALVLAFPDSGMESK